METHVLQKVREQQAVRRHGVAWILAATVLLLLWVITDGRVSWNALGAAVPICIYALSVLARASRIDTRFSG